MKNLIIFLLLPLVCLAGTCKRVDSENCHYSIKFVNNTERSLYAMDKFQSINYPDPFEIRGYQEIKHTKNSVVLCVINIVTQRTTEDAQRHTEEKLHQLLFDNS